MNGLFASEMKGAEFGSLVVKEMSIGNTIVWSSAPPIVKPTGTGLGIGDKNDPIVGSNLGTYTGLISSMTKVNDFVRGTINNLTYSTGTNNTGALFYIPWTKLSTLSGVITLMELDATSTSSYLRVVLDTTTQTVYYKTAVRSGGSQTFADLQAQSPYLFFGVMTTVKQGDPSYYGTKWFINDTTGVNNSDFNVSTGSAGFTVRNSLAVADFKALMSLNGYNMTTTAHTNLLNWCRTL